MGLFDRLRSAAPPPGKPDTSEQDATRLIGKGHVLEAEGKFDEAMQCYLEAIRLAPNPARGHLNLGNVLLLKDDLQGALDAFSTAIRHKPDYAGAYYNIGNALLNDGKLDDAVMNYRQALQIQPDYAEVLCSLGVALYEQGKLEEAVQCHRRALVLVPNFIEAHTNLGNTLQALGQFESAAASYQRALELNPHLCEAHNNLGKVLQKLGKLDKAAACYQRALQIRPDYAEVSINLGNIWLELGQHENAISCYQDALQIKPDYAEAHCNIGLALQNLNQLDAGIASLIRALEIKPNYAEAHYNLGIALNSLGQMDRAEASYRRALEIKHDFAKARFNLGLLLLSQGRYAEGWPEFEARYDPGRAQRNSITPNLPFPRWQGEPLSGKSILVWPEQGFGDEIQFVRYIPLLRALGASRITLACRPPLKTLLKTITGADAVVLASEATSLPPHDYWIFPLSLPLHFATTVQTIPATLPYLSAQPERLSHWKSCLSMDGLKVGLVWKGSILHDNDANRSLPSFSTLAPLWSVPGVTFVSLQKGQGEEEAATPPTNQPILHLGSDISDFADTAAIVAQLDLLICIDTAIAHLAGALNKPCWVLLPASGTDWRWLRDRTDSPWYPGVMQLFRQTKTGGWDATIGEVAKNLKLWVSRRSSTI